MCGRVAAKRGRYRDEQIGRGYPNIEIEGGKDIRPTNPLRGYGLLNGEPGQLELRWGLEPAWAKHLLINAKAETVATLRTFRDALEYRRCLVPVFGWYEWRKEYQDKQRY